MTLKLDRQAARVYMEKRFASFLDECYRLGLMFHVAPEDCDGHILYSNELGKAECPVWIQVDDDADDPAFREAKLDRELKLVQIALSFARANLDELNEALGYDDDECEKPEDRIQEEELAELLKAYGAE